MRTDDPMRHREDGGMEPPAPAILAIGASTGGPQALARLLSGLPADFPMPVVIVQHMPPRFTAHLAENLNAVSVLPVCEASDGQALQASRAYIAPGGRQMGLVRRVSGRTLVELSDAPPENHCRPAVDYLFRSVAEAYGAGAIAVLLTGMGMDGTAGMRAMKARGAWTLGQDRASCVVYGMPRSAKEAGLLDMESDPEGLARALAGLRRPGRERP